MALAAISASQARAVGFRPEARNYAATDPNARADSASNTSTSKSDSACCKCAWRAARSSSVWATCGATDSSANMIALTHGFVGQICGVVDAPKQDHR